MDVTNYCIGLTAGIGSYATRANLTLSLNPNFSRFCINNTPFTTLNEHAANKAVVDVRLCPHCALPSPTSRPIGRIACAQNFPDFYLHLPDIVNDPFCWMTLLAIEWPLVQRTRYSALWLGRITPKIAPSLWNFVTLPEEDRATAIGNMQKKFGKDHLCGSRDMLADRQTDTHTQTYSSQYFAIASTGEVITSDFEDISYSLCSEGR